MNIKHRLQETLTKGMQLGVYSIVPDYIPNELQRVHYQLIPDEEMVQKAGEREIAFRLNDIFYYTKQFENETRHRQLIIFYTEFYNAHFYLRSKTTNSPCWALGHEKDTPVFSPIGYNPKSFLNKIGLYHDEHDYTFHTRVQKLLKHQWQYLTILKAIQNGETIDNSLLEESIFLLEVDNIKVEKHYPMMRLPKLTKQKVMSYLGGLLNSKNTDIKLSNEGVYLLNHTLISWEDIGVVHNVMFKPNTPIVTKGLLYDAQTNRLLHSHESKARKFKRNTKVLLALKK